MTAEPPHRPGARPDARPFLLFEGAPVPVREGQSVAAALVAAGVRALRETADGAARGVFCGMGVCQECLVEIDGRPGLRACIEKAAAGLSVRRQPARPSLEAAPPAEPGGARVLAPDLLVVGGGAGGLAAATAAARAGARVLMADDRPTPGGQYFKQPAGAPALDAQQAEGARRVAAAAEAGVETLRAEVWGAFDGPVFTAAAGFDAIVIRPRATVLATGAAERPRIVPGWELPGVMTAGAAQTLWRSYRTLPGARVVAAGAGPLTLQVALELAEGGATAVAVCEAAPAPWTRPGAALRMLTADPRLALAGARMVARLRALGAPVRHGTVIERIAAAPGGLAVTLRRSDGARETVEADAVLMNDGFHPSNELLRLLGARMAWSGRFRELRPVRSDELETSVAGVWAVGDSCGLGGAHAAAEEGAIAGAAAARRLGFAAPEPPGARARLARHRAFQAALWEVHARPEPDLAALPPETLVCRCESVSRAALDAAIDETGGDVGAVKRATRVGMGRCQGRYCGHALAALVEARFGRPVDEAAFFAPRTPVRPTPLAAILAAAPVAEALAAPGDPA